MNSKMDSNFDSNYNQKNDSFIDLCQQVFSNELILSKILRHLSLKELFCCQMVCNKWQNESKRVITKRSQSLNVFHLFRTETKPKDVLITDDQSVGRTDEELDFCSRLHWVDKYDFNSNVIKSIVNDLYSCPEVCLMIYGSFGEDVKLSQRLCQMETIRRSLPDKKCIVLNLNSQCLIGCPTTSSVPMQKISHFGDLGAVSLLLLPKYRSGVDITVFTGTDMREKIFKLPDIKSILLFTTSSIFQDNRNLYLDINTISRFITTTFKDRVAFGGYNSAYFSFNRNDFLNYLVTDGDTDQLQPREMIGLCFSGDRVNASSLLINTKRLNKTEAKLREFKNSLGFEAINNDFYETIGFIFSDEEKSDAFVKLDLFRSVFIGCPVIGVAGYGQYGFNYWPTLESTPKRKSNKRQSQRLIPNKPKKGNKVKRVINLNTNMTTFVVIRLQKKVC